MSYKVITKGNPLEVWAMGFYSKDKAEKMIAERYWHRYMYPHDRHKELEVIEETKTKEKRYEHPRKTNRM